MTTNLPNAPTATARTVTAGPRAAVDAPAVAAGAVTAGDARRRAGFRCTRALAVVMALLALGACRGGGPASDGEALSGDPVTEGAAPTGTVAVGAAATEATVAPGPVPVPPTSVAPDTRPTPTLPATAKVGLAPQGKEPLNDLGDPVRLDETASLACAHAEFALEAFDDADPGTARQEITATARWGTPSANADISRASLRLGSAGGTVPASREAVDAFLGLCRANGHR